MQGLGATGVLGRLRDRRTGLRHAVLAHPTVGPAYLKVNPRYHPLTLHRSTRVAIDGYPRSANSYAMFAFLHANPGRGVFAGHTHSPHLLRLAAERGIPSILLLREPGAASASYAQYLATSNLTLLLDAWTRFHALLQPLASRLVVAPFETVTTDFGRVIKACNARYGTTFAVYRSDEDSEREVRRRLDLAARSWGTVQRHRVARPDSARRPTAKVLEHLDNAARRALDRATKTYLDLLAHSHDDAG